MSDTVVTRFPPSPTGFLHIGSARTALFNYLFARQNGGTFILRIEDTDKARSKKEFEDNILEGMTWLGLEHDAFYRQSERTELYKRYIEKLIEEKKAYVSEETSDTLKRSSVIRFKNPNTKISFPDIIRGQVTFDTEELGDFVIAKDLEEPLYHLTVVIDDFEMGVTHVIRGEDHISNTPRQILIAHAIGAPEPEYAHLPLILAPDRSKLSKRHGAVGVTEYEAMGYLPEAIINYLALLGWNPGTAEEIFTISELIEKFDLNKIQKGGAIFNLDKLKWINKKHLEKLPREILHSKIKTILTKKFQHISDIFLDRLMPTIMERIETYGDLEKMVAGGELDYFFIEPSYTPQALIWKESNRENTIKRLTRV
ncbi:MAG: glutamate--tRNA ligase family protein, partial [bacterium]|nr:glutamate--tRNA ligase family protein [bacterium]